MCASTLDKGGGRRPRAGLCSSTWWQSERIPFLGYHMPFPGVGFIGDARPGVFATCRRAISPSSRQALQSPPVHPQIVSSEPIFLAPPPRRERGRSSRTHNPAMNEEDHGPQTLLFVDPLEDAPATGDRDEEHAHP